MSSEATEKLMGKPIIHENSSKWHIQQKGMSADDIRQGFLDNLEYRIAKDRTP